MKTDFGSLCLKVMSFNIRYGLAEDGINRWDNRKPLVLDRIRAFEPDLLGLQECRDDAQAAYLKTNLPDYHFHGVRRGGEGETALEMAPALYRNSRFRVGRSGHFWLSDTPEIPGSQSWDSLFPRTATWAELEDRETGRLVVFLNTHFDFRPVSIEKSAQLLRRWIERTVPERPVILTGDFNAGKNSAAYRHLTGNGLLLDAYRQAHPTGSDEATFHAYGQPGQLAPIDWLLVSKHFAVVEAGTDRYHESSLFPSDHYPVTAVLEWRT